MKKKVQPSYDEASTGSSDSDDSSSSDDASSSDSLGGNLGQQDATTKQRTQDAPSLSSDEEGDDDGESSSSEEGEGNNDDDDDSSANDDGKQMNSSSMLPGDLHFADKGDEDIETNLPLHERVARQEVRGVSLQKKRERKRSALELASEKLARLKKAKREEKDTAPEVHEPEPKEVHRRKKSKHAPTEASSKRADFYRRGAPRLNESGIGVEVGARAYKALDPRTSSLSGHLNEEQFEKNYEFLQELRNKEMVQLKKQITARKVSGKKGKRMRRQLNVSLANGSIEDDEERLRKLKQEKADFERRKIERAAKQAVKRKIRDEVEEGKRGAFYLKRKEKKRLEFEAKMEELKKRGGHKAVEKALAKRRQKAKSRDAGIFAK